MVDIEPEWSNLVSITDSTAISIDFAEDSRRKKVFDRWRSAATRAVRQCVDPWRKFDIHKLPVLKARRFRYSAIRKTWNEDFVEIKMLEKPFARGAMRECFRVKKLSNMGFHQDWQQAQNYVAKRYIQGVPRETIFDDVKLQMDCKLWAEEFNRNNPPKKIDIVQMSIIQIIDWPDQPYYHLEHFIEGDYVKYNSNSGFVSEVQRNTPQAFSHFTFERSAYQMIVVDIQGVGDLYTDPQIHTVNGTNYGDGNLGTKGMALFFRSHKCNDICKMLGLTEFDLAKSEKEILTEPTKASVSSSVYAPTRFVNKNHKKPTKMVPITEQVLPIDLSPYNDAMQCLRERSRTLTLDSNHTLEETSSMASSKHIRFNDIEEHDDDCTCKDCISAISKEAGSDEEDEEDNDAFAEENGSSGYESAPAPRKVGRYTLSMESSDPSFRTRTSDSMLSMSSAGEEGHSHVSSYMEREKFWSVQRKKSMPAGVVIALKAQKRPHEITRHVSILGQIHLDLARYHELGRFLPEDEANKEKIKVLEEMNDACASVRKSSSSEDSGIGQINYDREAALFHLDMAKKCGNLEAILTIAKMCYNMPHELLVDLDGDDYLRIITDEDVNNDTEKFAFDLMTRAAEMGDRSAILFVAKCYESGEKMGHDATISYPSAVFWLEKALGFEDDEESTELHRPKYELLANIASIYQEGGFGLEKDNERAYELYNEAAESAMENMKGKLANKYYELAETCS